MKTAYKITLLVLFILGSYIEGSCQNERSPISMFLSTNKFNHSFKELGDGYDATRDFENKLNFDVGFLYTVAINPKVRIRTGLLVSNKGYILNSENSVDPLKAHFKNANQQEFSSNIHVVYLEIPVSGIFSIVENNSFLFYTSLGVNLGKKINRVYVENSVGDWLEENVSKTILYPNFGLGVSFKYFNELDLTLEPYYSYYFNPIDETNMNKTSSKGVKLIVTVKR